MHWDQNSQGIRVDGAIRDVEGQQSTELKQNLPKPPSHQWTKLTLAPHELKQQIEQQAKTHPY